MLQGKYWRCLRGLSEAASMNPYVTPYAYPQVWALHTTWVVLMCSVSLIMLTVMHAPHL